MNDVYGKEYDNYKGRLIIVMDLFRTTNKGVNLNKDLGAYTDLSRSFYGYSMGIEIMFLCFFVCVFSMSIFRSLKKIKDPHFNHEVKQ